MVSLGAVLALVLGAVYFSSVQQADAAMYAVNMLEGGGGSGNTSTNTSSGSYNSPAYTPPRSINGICY